MIDNESDTLSSSTAKLAKNLQTRDFEKSLSD